MFANDLLLMVQPSRILQYQAKGEQMSPISYVWMIKAVFPGKLQKTRTYLHSQNAASSTNPQKWGCSPFCASLESVESLPSIFLLFRWINKKINMNHANKPCYWQAMKLKTTYETYRGDGAVSMKDSSRVLMVSWLILPENLMLFILPNLHCHFMSIS